ncbi:class I SAM-dependent methyltransferase [Dictyobacter aurantiacus]|uniref:SAM-dependent methyltransferase n=1 Tax=Dictyobacter aurantiacus TaxID=1936993 RepID=A0A401ZTG5_9CHLR|nr:class I SAM-dependent methyltransferase [Dictyobacter aurantiacus]GCE10064.1 SAM-dependent methyltransferase [Dictyobacter aurantiacus]
MTDVAQHYEQLLAEYYSWMFGPFDEKVAEQRALFERWGVVASGTGTALDLGSGSGFQSIALVDLGFRVMAIDLSQRLLMELVERKGERAIVPIQGDIRDVVRLVDTPVDLVVCMGDTLPHLESRDEVLQLLRAIHHLLVPGGRCVLSFRDLSVEQRGLDRFIPVRSDASTILTCFLEYEPAQVVVHDLLYVREGEQWTLRKSSYRKLRLSSSWLVAQLQAIGFMVEVQESQRGMSFLGVRKHNDAKSIETSDD